MNNKNAVEIFSSSASVYCIVFCFISLCDPFTHCGFKGNSDDFTQFIHYGEKHSARENSCVTSSAVREGAFLKSDPGDAVMMSSGLAWLDDCRFVYLTDSLRYRQEMWSLKGVFARREKSDERHYQVALWEM